MKKYPVELQKTSELNIDHETKQKHYYNFTNNMHLKASVQASGKILKYWLVYPIKKYI